MVGAYIKQYLKIKKMTIRDAVEYAKKFKKNHFVKDLLKKEEELKEKMIEEHEK